MPMDPDAAPFSAPRREPSPPMPPVGYGGAPLVESMSVHERPRYTRRGNPMVFPDPGTPTSRRITLLLTVLLATLVILWQNIGTERRDRLIQAPPPPPPAAQAADQPAPGGMADPMIRAFLRVRGFVASSPEKDRADLVKQVATTVAGEADEVRVIMMAAELLGTEDALARIQTLRSRLLEPPSDETPPDEVNQQAANRALLLTELDALETIYQDGPDQLEPAARDQLVARYGRLGEFALSHGQPESQREKIIGGAWSIILLFGFLGFGAAVVLLTGLVLLVFGLVWYGRRTTVMHCPRPDPGGSVMLETYTVFLAGFAALSISAALIEAHASDAIRDAARTLHLPVQWLLMLTVLWPLVRGMSAYNWRQAMGLHAGRGVAREMGAGLVAYLASLPLFLAGTMVSVILMALWNFIKTGSGDAPPPQNPYVELIGSADWVVLLLFFTLATIWAPVTEELIFRGALYRHLRSRLHWTLAAVLSAVLFSLMHAYGPLMAVPLIMLGFMFAFMREWRGSIIAPMTAHFLHNFTLLTVMFTIFRVVG